jgi:hypothetical protein
MTRARGAAASRGPTSDLDAIRVQAARRCDKWTELDPVDLVERGRFLVHAASGEVFTAYAGAVWNGPRLEFGDQSPLFFTVDNGRVRLFEKYPRTWSEIIAAQARSARRAGAR